jgi:hypothetical protein
MVLGHKVYAPWRPRVQVIEIPHDRASDDLGALVAGAGQQGSKVTTRLVNLPADRPGDWTGQAAVREATSHQQRGDLVPLRGALGANFAFHEAPTVAPRPWERELFLFEVCDDGRVKHLRTGKIFDGSSPALRAVASPNYLITQKTPLYSEPASPKLKVFLPEDDLAQGVHIETLRDRDPIGYEIAQEIRSHVINTTESLNEEANKFQHWLNDGLLRFSRYREYTLERGPLLLLSKASRSPQGPGRARGILCSVWINLDGSVVPVQGYWARFPSRELAVAVALFLNIPEAVPGLFVNATLKNEGTKQFIIAGLSSWRIPPLTSSRYRPLMQQMMVAFKAYRARARKLEEAAALATDEYRELQHIGMKLWQM